MEKSIPIPAAPAFLASSCANATVRRRLLKWSALGSMMLALGALPTIGLAAAPTAQGAGCETWVGDFAAKPSTPAFMRIEHSEKGFIVRPKREDGSWSAETFDLEDITLKSDLGVSGSHGCVLAGGGAVLIQAPKGTAYQATALSGRNFSTYHMETDALMLVMQGFQVDGRDLYRVAAEGVSPPPVPPLPKAIPGKEVSSLTCPGGRPPVISQAAFDALPTDYRERFQSHTAEAQTDVVCGQRLNDLLSLDTFTDVDLDANRAATLAEVVALLSAGEEPRNDEGNVTWWSAARHWLMRNTPLSDTALPAPLQAEYFAAFNDGILPRLPKARVEDSQTVADVVRYILAMPEAQAVHALGQLQALGALDLQMVDGNVARSALPWALAPEVSEAAFEVVLKAANVSQKSTRDLFDTAIDKHSAVGVARLLKHGFDPRDADVLLRARSQPKLYATLLEAAFQRAEKDGGKLPPDVIDPVVRTELREGKTINWSAIEPLLQHGGDLSRSFVTDVRGDNASLAFFARSSPDKFLDLITHGLRVDLPYPPGGDSLLTRYLRLRIDWMPGGPRADVVEAMLKLHNNAASGKPCTDCVNSPLGVALSNEGPNSVDVVKVLLRYGADPNALDAQGFPAFSYAIMDDRLDLLDAMGQGPQALNLKLTDPNGFSLLAVARCYDAGRVAAWLRQHGAGQPEQGYAACRQGLAAQRKKVGAAR